MYDRELYGAQKEAKDCSSNNEEKERERASLPLSERERGSEKATRKVELKMPKVRASAYLEHPVGDDIAHT